MPNPSSTTASTTAATATTATTATTSAIIRADQAHLQEKAGQILGYGIEHDSLTDSWKQKPKKAVSGTVHVREKPGYRLGIVLNDMDEKKIKFSLGFSVPNTPVELKAAIDWSKSDALLSFCLGYYEDHEVMLQDVRPVDGIAIPTDDEGKRKFRSQYGSAWISEGTFRRGYYVIYKITEATGSAGLEASVVLPKIAEASTTLSREVKRVNVDYQVISYGGASEAPKTISKDGDIDALIDRLNAGLAAQSFIYIEGEEGIESYSLIYPELELQSREVAELIATYTELRQIISPFMQTYQDRSIPVLDELNMIDGKIKRAVGSLRKHTGAISPDQFQRFIASFHKLLQSTVDNLKIAKDLIQVGEHQLFALQINEQVFYIDDDLKQRGVHLGTENHDHRVTDKHHQAGRFIIEYPAGKHSPFLKPDTSFYIYYISNSTDWGRKSGARYYLGMHQTGGRYHLASNWNTADRPLWTAVSPSGDHNLLNGKSLMIFSPGDHDRHLNLYPHIAAGVSTVGASRDPQQITIRPAHPTNEYQRRVEFYIESIAELGERYPIPSATATTTTARALMPAGTTMPFSATHATGLDTPTLTPVASTAAAAGAGGPS